MWLLQINLSYPARVRGEPPPDLPGDLRSVQLAEYALAHNLHVSMQWNFWRLDFIAEALGDVAAVAFGRFMAEALGEDLVGEAFGESEAFMAEALGEAFVAEAFGEAFIAEAFGEAFIAEAFGEAFMAEALGEAFMAEAFGEAFMGEAFGEAFMGEAFGVAFMEEAFGEAFMAEAFGEAFIAEAFGEAFIADILSRLIVWQQQLQIWDLNALVLSAECGDFSISFTTGDALALSPNITVPLHTGGYLIVIFVFWRRISNLIKASVICQGFPCPSWRLESSFASITWKGKDSGLVTATSNHHHGRAGQILEDFRSTGASCKAVPSQTFIQSN